jgi:hypothetical protein
MNILLLAATETATKAASEPGIAISTWNIVLGFFLTTVVGGILSYVWSELARRREKNHQILVSRLRNQRTLLESLARDMGERAFRAERLYWAVDDFPKNPKVTKKRLTRIKKRWDEYYESVIAWNLSLPRYRMRVAFYASKPVADTLCQKAKEGHSSESPTLHGKFAAVHKKVKELVDKADQRQPETSQEVVDQCQKSLNELYDQIDEFLLGLQLAFRESIREEPWRRRRIDESLADHAEGESISK